MSWLPFLLFAFFGTVWAQDLSHDIDVNYLKKSRTVEPDAEIRPSAVKRFFGVQDSKAVIGRLFSYKIPKDAFEGDVKSFHFPNHPHWLIWNEREKSLQGVPSAIDEGHSYVTVVAEGASSNAKDLFEISVIPATEKMLLKESSCKPNSEVTVMSVIVDSSLSSLKPRKRVKLMHKVSKLLNINPQQISLSSPESDINGENIEFIDKRRNNHLLSKDYLISIEVIVGCNGEISKKNIDLVAAITRVSSTGKMERVLGHKVIGWHITKKNTNSKVVKRQANNEEYEYSGDYNDYEGYDDNYDYVDYDSFFKNNPVVENTPVDTTTTEAGAHVETTIAPTASFPPNPTQTFIPVKPTRVIDASPSTVLPSVPPTDHGKMHLESSMSVYPTEIIDTTTPVMNMTKSPGVSRSYQPIEPSVVPDIGEHTEYGLKNFAPYIKKRIPKLSWSTGKVHKIIVPEDAFEDHEDGETRQLTLVLKDDQNRPLNYNSWIQIDQLNQQIYALPLEKDISTFRIILEAVDKGGESAADQLSIRLSQPKEARNIHHQYTVTLKLDKMYQDELLHALDWQILAVEKIARIFGGLVEDINVRNISTDSMLHITWTNITLVDSESRVCPVEQLENQAKTLIERDDMPTDLAKEIFEPQFKLERVSVKYLKKCAHLNNWNIGVKAENSPPMFRNPIDSLTAYQGKLFRYKVPEDTCYDLEEGMNSKMRLLTGDLDTLPPSFWLQFDEANKEFYGLPLKTDTIHRNYVLECIDSGQKKDSDSMEIYVVPSEDKEHPVQFSLTLNADYNAFMANVKTKVDFVEKLAMAFGDSNPDSVTIDRFEPGSVKVIWHNNTLDSDTCPNSTINSLRSIMADKDGNLKDSFKASFEPYFEVTDVHVRPTGVCLSYKNPTHEKEPDVETSTKSEASGSSEGKEDYLLTFIIPGVLIAVMIILAVIIAFCLYRRRRYAKMSLADDKTFVPNKGYPIIFAEELDDHSKSDRANNPVIMKQEKGPLPPPEYQRHSPGIMGTPPRERGSLPPVDHGPYQPPQPPYASANGSNRNSRPNMPPVYKKPPTYVPP